MIHDGTLQRDLFFWHLGERQKLAPTHTGLHLCFSVLEDLYLSWLEISLERRFAHLDV